jgi:hypothetical protein
MSIWTFFIHSGFNFEVHKNYTARTFSLNAKCVMNMKGLCNFVQS